MDERRRFQIALGGIGSCLVIAALFVSSAPPLEYPAVRAPKAAYRVLGPGQARPVSLAEGCGIEVPDERPPVARPRAARAALQARAIPELLSVQRVATSPVLVGPVGSAPLRPRASQIVLTSAPAARAASFAAPVVDAEATTEAEQERGPVAGAFATVGREVGHGFRTAGRAIKSIF